MMAPLSKTRRLPSVIAGIFPLGLILVSYTVNYERLSIFAAEHLLQVPFLKFDT